MATKKKVEQPASEELQQIIGHFGENSAELAEAKAKQNKPIKPQIFYSDEAVEHLIYELSKGAE